MDGERGLPLEGVQVLDLGQIYQGPYAGFLLATGGADVVKVEPPEGEPTRRRANYAGASLPMAILGSCKRGITLNLKSAAGRALLVELVQRADVLLENYAPTVTERLGVGPDVLMEANPRLIYASGSGYGRSGPSRDDLAMDLTIQARAGFMSVTGEPDRPPVKAGPAVCDFLGGTHLYAAIVTALYERERTGRGRLVEVSMLEASFPALASALGMHHLSGGAVPPRTGSRHAGLAMAPYNVYPTTDGFVAIICTTDAHWRHLCGAMGRPDLGVDPRYETHTERAALMDEVDGVVSAWTSVCSRDQVWDACRAHHVPAAPVRDLNEALADEHLHQRGYLVGVDHPELGRVTLPRSPLRFAGSELRPLTPSPGLSEHTTEVLGDWLGLAPAEVEKLRADGAL